MPKRALSPPGGCAGDVSSTAERHAAAPGKVYSVFFFPLPSAKNGIPAMGKQRQNDLKFKGSLE